MKLKTVNVNGRLTPLSNLVIVVGPNGSGKTRFLQDLFVQFISSTPTRSHSDGATKWTNLVNGDFLSTTKSEWDTWVKSLKPINGAPSQQNQKAYAIDEYMSHDERSLFLDETSLHNLKIAMERNMPLDDIHAQYGSWFKAQYSELLRVERRLYISQNAMSTLSMRYSMDLRPPTFLAVHPETLNRINRILIRLFGKQIYVLSHNSPQYSIDVVKAGTVKPKNLVATTQNLLKQKEIYQDWHKSNGVIGPGEEGHGVRAALEILYNLENPAKKVLFIDEPELHLYPSAKYQIGQTVAQYTATNAKQVILATHDTDFLAGLIRGSRDATIIRISSDHSTKSFSSGPINRAYSGDILQSAFQDAVIIVEGVSDEFIYRNAFELRRQMSGISYQVIPAHGADRASEALPFAQELGVAVALVLDFDTLFKSNKKLGHFITVILKSMNVDPVRIRAIIEKIEEVKVLPVPGDQKKFGLNAKGLDGSGRNLILELLGMLEKEGVFVVPFGGVEQWVGLPSSASPESVFNRFRNRPSKYSELNSFLGKIAAYLKQTL